MIRIRKLAAVDMAWLGARVILLEYALGVLLPLILGILSVRAGGLGFRPLNWESGLGLWLIGIAANYVPMLIYAILIARAGSVAAESKPEIARAKRYGIQQVMLLVPLLVTVVAILQERQVE